MDVDSLDFVAPVTGSVGALNGNDSANRVAINNSIAGINLADTSTIWFRWVGADATGNDYGLGVDDFVITAITPVPEPAEWGLICAVGLLGVCGLHTWRESRRAQRQSPSGS